MLQAELAQHGSTAALSFNRMPCIAGAAACLAHSSWHSWSHQNSPARLPCWLIAAQVHGAAYKVPNGALVFGVEGLYKVAKVKLQR